LPRLVREVVADPDAFEHLAQPRRSVVVEREVEPGIFEADRGPVRDYRRTVERAGDVVRQTVEYRMVLPYFAVLFALPMRKHLGRLGAADKTPWWAPPDPLDVNASRALGSLGLMTVLFGFMGTLLTQTIAFAAKEFGEDRSAQGVTLSIVRLDVVLALAVVTLGDRRGRRSVLLVATAAGAALTATAALVPGLEWLAASQVLTRGFVTGGAILSGVMAAEEMPAGSRAYAISVLGLLGALGAGICVMLLPIADLGTSMWRVLWVVPLLFLPAIVHLRKTMPESRRFRAPHAEARVAGHGRRFWLLAVSALLVAVFSTPASQFQNEYLLTERGFSAARMSLFTIATNTPGAIGVVIGGRLADTRGRRGVGAFAMAGGAIATVLMFLAAGWPLWAWSVTGAIIGAAAIPALGVYGPELFPTSMRGTANGVITVLGRVGSVIGLLVAGIVADRFDTLGPAMAVLSVGPLLLAVLVITAYPETAHLELEDINPEDRRALP
jgi:MFS family permease